ncbi:D-alanyl-D-alanine carboxypeptidase family protein [Hathewaya limosa]|uniref:serine-type D-Ala-D-Ala carboxypeptidase n=1 Tax=Hathewaya limosa TaxID=1536 RepID=A0ABU0JRN8_HATLI|nr:D-alanyl-D-alanine carboxypeptidase family protein [Hathewaya limosa]MDQ0479762.1 D-alanyl-D-alanine carboxypeptidase (penicillin-binding protein 5/6) [Hathewaya limosa]
MKKRSLLVIMLSIFFTFSIFTKSILALNAEKIKKEPVKENKGLDVEARSALLIEPSTGKILFEKNKDEQYAPASVTKVMTMLLTMEAVDSGKIKLKDKVTVSENAKKMGGSTMLLDTGEVRTVEELLKGVGIASGNDAAVALGEYLAGSEDAFVQKMNKRANELGMKNTTFKNCTGLPIEGHKSTANDISKMSMELLKHPQILKYTGTYMETISEGRKSPIELVNHNKLVRFFKGCDGLKTGFTNEAKYCISATATKNHVRMLCVIMGAPTYKIRNRDASALMNYGFSKFEYKNVIKKDSEIEKVVFNKKGDKYLIAKAKDEFSIALERGKDNKIEKKTILNKKKQYKKGEEIGRCDILLNGKVCGSVKVYSDRDIRVGNFLNELKDNLIKMFDNAV